MITVINCSPTRKGVTYNIAKSYCAFLTSKSDTKIEMISLSDLNIGYCKGYQTCFNVGKCPLDRGDDFIKLKNLIMKSKSLVFVIPVYSHNVPGIFKTVIDRLSYLEHFFGLAGRKATVLVQANSNGVSETLQYINKIIMTLGIELIDSQGIKLVDMQRNSSILQKVLIEQCNKILDVNTYRQTFVTDYQNQVFDSFKSLVIGQEQKGQISYKVKKWKELRKYDNYKDYLVSLYKRKESVNT